jgi:NADH-quinone oxidoreductase subunit N
MGNEYLLASPLIVISLLSVIGIVIDALSGKNKNLYYFYALATFIITGGLAVYTMMVPGEQIDRLTDVSYELVTRGMITFGGYAAFFDVLFCAAAIMTMFAARPYFRREYDEYKEFYSLMMFSVAGMMLIAHSANLLILFIGIEIMSIAFYVLSGFFRDELKSIEAGLKYFLLGAFASGFLLYGIAMIYGATGSFDIAVIAENIAFGDATPVYLMIGVGMLIVGLGFKVAAFPFHQWAPDVYHGAPTVVTGFMSTAGKAAALVGFIVVARAILPASGMENIIAANTANTKMIIAVIAAATMLVGNITALVQENVKRMLAYSSVAHAGYLLMGIVANSPRGWAGIAFYAAAYMFMQIGAFVVVSVLERKNEGNLMVKDYSGLNKKYPALAAVMAIFMFSLAGIPPFAGFFGKYYLFTAAIEAGFTWLTIVAVISSLISVYFYIGLIVNMYFREYEGELPEVKYGSANITLALTTAGVLIFGIFPSLLIGIANQVF